MSRNLLVLDRLAVAAVGLVLLLGGSLLSVWGLGRIPGTRAEIDLEVLRAAPDSTWWPWALGAGGVLAVLAGLRALVAHTIRPRVSEVVLPPPATGPAPADGATAAAAGSLRADLPAVADAAAEVLARTPGVDACRGRTLPERAGSVVELVARVDASTDAQALHRAVRDVDDGLARTLPPGVASLRVLLEVRRGRYEAPRVR